MVIASDASVGLTMQVVLQLECPLLYSRCTVHCRSPCWCNSIMWFLHVAFAVFY